jgi:hypothetical protein
VVTVGDLIEKLHQYDKDTPVYWGIDVFPCWETKRDATILDFPMRIEHVKTHINLDRYITYLYFGDYGDVERLKNKYYKIPAWIRRMFN